MTVKYWKNLALFTLAAGLGGCGAQDLGSQYEEIGEAESKLVFSGPGLENGYPALFVLTSIDEELSG